jgi:predicted nucleic acid-binding Zn ribbon protein
MMHSQPRRIGDIMSELLARRGYAREQSADRYSNAWRQAAGEPLASCSRATQVRRGVLEVWVSDSTMVQEIGFQKAALLGRLAESLPEEKIRDLKLRLGSLS